MSINPTPEPTWTPQPIYVQNVTAPQTPTDGFAVTSLILGILAVTIGLLLWVFPVFPILACIFGHVALSRISSSGSNGKGMAIAGLATGYVGLAFVLFAWTVMILAQVS